MLNNIILVIQAHPLLSVVALTILSIVAIYIIASKCGIKFFNSAKSLIDFLNYNLKEFNYNNEKLNLILNLISQAISFGILINVNDDPKVMASKAMDYIKGVVNKLNEDAGTEIILSETDLEIIENVLKLLFTFMISLKIKQTTVKYNHLIKYNTKLMVKNMKAEAKALESLAKQSKAK